MVSAGLSVSRTVCTTDIRVCTLSRAKYWVSTGTSRRSDATIALIVRTPTDGRQSSRMWSYRSETDGAVNLRRKTCSRDRTEMSSISAASSDVSAATTSSRSYPVDWTASRMS